MAEKLTDQPERPNRLRRALMVGGVAVAIAGVSTIFYTGNSNVEARHTPVAASPSVVESASPPTPTPEAILPVTGVEEVRFGEPIQCLDGFAVVRPKDSDQTEVVYRPRVVQDKKGLWVQTEQIKFDEKAHTARFGLTNLRTVPEDQARLFVRNAEEPVMNCTIAGVVTQEVKGFDDSGTLVTVKKEAAGTTIITPTGLSPGKIFERTQTMGAGLTDLVDPNAPVADEADRIGKLFLDGKFRAPVTPRELAASLK